MKLRIIVTALLILLLSMGLASKAGAGPGRYYRVWTSGSGWGWRTSHDLWFHDGYSWRYRGNRVGVHGRVGRYYRPWSVKRREFHNSDNECSHRFYH